MRAREPRALASRRGSSIVEALTAMVLIGAVTGAALQSLATLRSALASVTGDAEVRQAVARVTRVADRCASLAGCLEEGFRPYVDSALHPDVRAVINTAWRGEGRERLGPIGLEPPEED